MRRERDDGVSDAAAANVSGSIGLTPKTSVPRKRVAATAAREASGRTPAPTSERPLDSTSRSTSRALRAERDADADFARPLRDAVRHDAVEADGREQHGDDGEAGQQPRHEHAAARPTGAISDRQRRDW